MWSLCGQLPVLLRGKETDSVVQGGGGEELASIISQENSKKEVIYSSLKESNEDEIFTSWSLGLSEATGNVVGENLAAAGRSKFLQGELASHAVDKVWKRENQKLLGWAVETKNSGSRNRKSVVQATRKLLPALLSLPRHASSPL